MFLLKRQNTLNTANLGICNNKVLIIGGEKLIQACGLGADVAKTFSAFLIYDCLAMMTNFQIIVKQFRPLVF